MSVEVAESSANKWPPLDTMGHQKPSTAHQLMPNYHVLAKKWYLYESAQKLQKLEFITCSAAKPQVGSASFGNVDLFFFVGRNEIRAKFLSPLLIESVKQ